MAEILAALPDYNSRQQAYCLSGASNAVGSKIGTTKDLEKAFKQTLDQLLPLLTPVNTWKTVWGPAVDKVLVVAIAGTAQWSWSAWNGDCRVAEVVEYDQWTSKWKANNIPTPVAAIKKEGSLASLGTCQFVKNILTYTSTVTSDSPLSKYLQDFQSQNQYKDYSIIFTGHSLGGAVGPSIALGLVQAGLLKKDKVYNVPTAGASPGNATFNARFVEHFPRSGYYNYVLYNTLDIVPQAWSVIEAEDRKISNILVIWGNAKEGFKSVLKLTVDYATKLSKSGTEYVGLPGESFTGRKGIPPGVGNFSQALPIGRYQHTGALWEELEITKFIDEFTRIVSLKPGVYDPPEIEDPGLPPAQGDEFI